MDNRLLGVVWCLLTGLTRSHAALLGDKQYGFVTFYNSAPPVSSYSIAPAPGPTVAPSPSLLAGGALVSGACGYGRFTAIDWPFNEVVALGPNNSIATGIGTNKLGCGQCINATCTGSNCAPNSSAGVVLLVTDGCPNCANNQLNVPSETFRKHFGSSLLLGQVNVSYQQVDCNPPGPIEVRVLQLSLDGGGYIALSLLSVAGSGMLAGIDIKTSGSQTWAPMANSYGGVWSASNFGAPPLDLRITTFQGDSVIATGAIQEANPGAYLTQVQFSPTAPALAPFSGANAPSSGLRLPVLAPQPQATLASGVAPTYSIGVRINAPLYFAPTDLTALGAYPNLIFSYIDCSGGSPILNLTIDRMMVPNAGGGSSTEFALHTLDLVALNTEGPELLYKIVDYSFFNLETGEFAQLYEPEYVSFDDSAYDGTVPVKDEDTNTTFYPRYILPSSLRGPVDFDYTILLPPGPNEAPTSAYLRALETMFYFLSTLTLGNSGGPSAYLTCSEGASQIGPWADYIRSILAQLAPSDQISAGGLFNNIPLGNDYGFQDTSFVINNAVIVGSIINATTELSSRDCGRVCRPSIDSFVDETICSSWSWCGSISGCGSGVPYRTCQVKASTAEFNSTAPNGFLNLRQNSTIRLTSGVLSLPPPTGLSLRSPGNSSSTYPGSPRTTAQSPANP